MSTSEPDDSVRLIDASVDPRWQLVEEPSWKNALPPTDPILDRRRVRAIQLARVQQRSRLARAMMAFGISLFATGLCVARAVSASSQSIRVAYALAAFSTLITSAILLRRWSSLRRETLAGSRLRIALGSASPTTPTADAPDFSPLSDGSQTARALASMLDERPATPPPSAADTRL